MTVNLISLWGLEASIAFGLSRGLGWGAMGVWWGRTLASGSLLGLWFRRGWWKHKEV
jgi:Na+-driven multidrug efflux pump